MFRALRASVVFLSVGSIVSVIPARPAPSTPSAPERGEALTEIRGGAPIMSREDAPTPLRMAREGRGVRTRGHGVRAHRAEY